MRVGQKADTAFRIVLRLVLHMISIGSYIRVVTTGIPL